MGSFGFLVLGHVFVLFDQRSEIPGFVPLEKTRNVERISKIQVLKVTLLNSPQRFGQ